MVKPVTGSGNVMQQRGKLGAYKQDLLAHRDGTGFRQDATTVDMNPQLTFFPSATVQGTLEAIETFLLNDDAFVSIGDNVNSFGMFNVGAAGYPTIESCFAGALATLRLSYRGGIIQLKAGRYNFQNTVTLPPGISVIGELSGTVINADTANPIFKISESEAETIRVAPSVTADGSKQNKLYNLTFFDSFGGANPNLNLSTFITCERGSNLRVEQCAVFGKIGAAGSPPPTTRFFISYDTGTTSALNSILYLENNHIAAVQQIVDFDTEVARDNKLYVRNNRFLVSGRLGVPITNQATSAVTFRVCDATLSHNQIWFGLDIAPPSLQTIRTAFSCYDKGSSSAIKNMVVVGNQGHFFDDTLTDNDNRLLSEDNDGLEFVRSAISGNTMGGASDFNWCVVVGDGVDSVGDINGEYALQNLVKYFYNMNLGSGHGGVTVFLRHGSYTIDDNAIFEPPATTTATGLPLALIGLNENGNFPTINFNVSVPDTNGQEMMFGHHIENVYFDGGSNYYKVMIRNEFANPDTRTPFFRNVVIKNCSFNNCSIDFISAAASAVTNEYMKNEILIEGCQFSNTAVISNMASPEDMFAITCNNKNGKIVIRKCHTISAQWRGLFFTFDSATATDTAANCQVYIDNCVITTVDMPGGVLDYVVNVQDIKTFYFTNNTLDLASVAFGTEANGLFIKFNTDSSYEALCNITNNNFKGNNGTVLNYAASIFGAEKLNVSKNTFRNFYHCVGCSIMYFGTSTTLHALSFNINENRFIAGSRSYGFVLVTNVHAGALTNVLTGEVNVINNSLDYTSQGVSFPTVTNLDNMKAPINLSVKSPIVTGTDDIQVNVKNNKIREFNATLSTVTYTECCISVMGANSCNIVANDIDFRNTSSAGEFDAIYVSNNGVGSTGAPLSNINAMATIHQNRVVMTNSTGANETYIFARNVGKVQITENFLNKSGGSNALYNIKAYSEGDLSLNPYSTMDGVIVDNILDVNATNDLKLKDSSWQFNKVKLTVGMNKNLSVNKEIDCTHFRVYGYNRINGSANGQEHAAIMWRDNSLVSTSPSDKQIHIINDGLDGYGVAGAGWTTLPDGLYWTNATTDTATSPSLPNNITDYSKVGAENKHQVIVPISIPDFCRIERIRIPIYLRNDSIFVSRTLVAGASALVGNHVGVLTQRIYELSAAASFANTSTVVGTLSNAAFALDSTFTDFFDRLTGTVDSTPLPTSLELYVVISLQVSGTYTPVNDFYFAIPYVGVTYAY